MSLTSCRNTVLESLLDLVWSQWVTLGVPGHGSEAGNWMLDPEALVIFTCSLGRYEARVFDSMLEWLQVHQRLLNVQRLKTISARHGFFGKELLAPIANLISNPVNKARWERMGKANVDDRSVSEPLFRLKDGRPHPHTGITDASFERAGYLRAPVRMSRKSGFFDPHEPANLILKLRALFGNNSRCEVVAYLLTHPEANPTEMADATGYYSKTIYNTMTEMHLSGILNRRSRGRATLYSIDRGIWASFLGVGRVPGWIDWPRAFRALEILWLAWNTPVLPEETPENAGAHLALAVEKVLPLIRTAIPGSTLPSALFSFPGFSLENHLKATEELVRILSTG